MYPPSPIPEISFPVISFKAMAMFICISTASFQSAARTLYDLPKKKSKQLQRTISILIDTIVYHFIKN